MKKKQGGKEKAKAEAAAARAKAKLAKGDEDDDDEEDEEEEGEGEGGGGDEDDFLVNPNHVQKKMTISDLSKPRELSRRERLVFLSVILFCSGTRAFFLLLSFLVLSDEN
jgi:hypothetical protein